METPSTQEAQVKIRLNTATREQLKIEAAKNRRTLMREIEFRVIESLKQPQQADQLQGEQR